MYIPIPHTETLYTYTDTHVDRYQTNVLFWPLFTEPTDSFVACNPQDPRQFHPISTRRNISHPNGTGGIWVSHSPEVSCWRVCEIVSGRRPAQRCTDSDDNSMSYWWKIGTSSFLAVQSEELLSFLLPEGWDSKLPLQRSCKELPDVHHGLDLSHSPHTKTMLPVLWVARMAMRFCRSCSAADLHCQTVMQPLSSWM